MVPCSQGNLRGKDLTEHSGENWVPTRALVILMKETSSQGRTG